jgi:putative transposase
MQRFLKRGSAQRPNRAAFQPAAKKTMPAAANLRRGWFWGSQASAERMLRIGEAALRKIRSRGANASLEKQAHGEQEAATKRHLKTQSSSRACGTKFRKHWR